MTNIWKTLKLLWSKTNRWHIVLFILLVIELKLFPGAQLGFQCNDPALSHSYTGDTISWKWLMGVCILLPLVVMLITERIYHSEDKQRVNKRALRWYKEYLFGFLLNMDVMQTLKLVVGSPRPHFFDTCRPEEALTCEGSEFVSSYTCNKAHWLNQSDRSFPSGHSSLAVHAGLFIVYYLHIRTRPSNGVHTAQAMCLLTTVYCCVSRMLDHRHHWWDVIAGAAIGVASLAYTIHHLCKNFKCLNTRRESKGDYNTIRTSNKDKIPLIETKDK